MPYTSFSDIDASTETNVWVSHLFTSKSGGSFGPWDTQSACVGMTRNVFKCVHWISLIQVCSHLCFESCIRIVQTVAAARVWVELAETSSVPFKSVLSPLCAFVDCLDIQLEGSRSRIPFQAKHLAICKCLAENQHLRHEQYEPLKSCVCIYIYILHTSLLLCIWAKKFNHVCVPAMSHSHVPGRPPAPSPTRSLAKFWGVPFPQKTAKTLRRNTGVHHVTMSCFTKRE